MAAKKTKKKAKMRSKPAHRTIIVVAGNTVLAGVAHRLSKRGLASELKKYDPESDKGVVVPTRAFIVPGASEAIRILGGQYRHNFDRP
jgi:hypothetical protein